MIPIGLSLLVSSVIAALIWARPSSPFINSGEALAFWLFVGGFVFTLAGTFAWLATLL